METARLPAVKEGIKMANMNKVSSISDVIGWCIDHVSVN